MATGNITPVITVDDEFYNAYHTLWSNTYLVPNNIDFIPEFGDTAVVHWNQNLGAGTIGLVVASTGTAIASYTGQTATMPNNQPAFVYTNTTGVSVGRARTNRARKLLIKPRKARPPPSNKIVTFLKSNNIIEPIYYEINIDTNPIDTDLTIDKIPSPPNPIVVNRVDKELERSYAFLLDQVDNALDTYQIIKGFAECSPNIKLEQAVKCNKYLRRTLLND